MKKIIRQFFSFLKKWFWIHPISKQEPLKATDVQNNYTCIKYKGQLINLKISQVAAFVAMSRFDKRAMAKRFEILQKKGKIRFEKIKGKIICIKNKDYEGKADTK